MHNDNKHIDEFFSNKANEHAADNSFAKLDFEAIKAKLPIAPAATTLPKAKNWFGIKVLIAAVSIIAVSTFLYFANNLIIEKNTALNTVVNNVPSKNKVTKEDSIINNNTIANTTTENTKEVIKEKKLTKNTDSIALTKVNNTVQNISTSNTPILETFITGLKSEKQFYNINTERDTFIICKNGTLLEIKANSFTTLNKELAKGIVKIELKEAYTYADIIANGLQTVSNGNLLETGGMVFLKATLDGALVDIDIKKPIQLTIPSIANRNGMQLFYLDKKEDNNLLNSKRTWIANGQMQNAKNIKNLKNKYVLKETDNNNISNGYEFLIRNFGWINCDRFSKSNKEKVTTKIELQNENDSIGIHGLLIFPKLRSVINLTYRLDTFSMQNLPVDEEAYFVSFKTTAGNVSTIIQKIIISENIIKATAYKNIPTEQVKATLDAIGSVQ
jgi:hypothetical protein